MNLAVVAVNVLHTVQEVAGRRELLERAKSGRILEVPFHRRRPNHPGIPFGEGNGDGSSIQGVTYSIYVPVSLPLQLICTSLLHRTQAFDRHDNLVVEMPRIEFRDLSIGGYRGEVLWIRYVADRWHATRVEGAAFAGEHAAAEDDNAIERCPRPLSGTPDP